MSKIGMLITLLITIACACTVMATEPAVLVENGNIFYSADGSDKVQLTKSGKDRAPVLSPDGKTVAFIRKSDKEAYFPSGTPDDYSKEDLLADQLWIVGTDGGNEKLLVEDRDPDAKGEDWHAKNVIAHIWDKYIQFSPDSKRVYFITSAWVTSGAVHQVDIDGKNERFFIDSNYLKVIDKGGYKGHLIIQQHRYILTGGSYDWYYLVTPDGKEVGTFGDDLERIDWDSLYSDEINSR